MADNYSPLRLNEAGLQAAHQRVVALMSEARHEVAAQGVAPAAIETRAHVHVRYQGTDTALVVALNEQLAPRDAIAAIRVEFEAGYRQRFAFLMPDRALVIEAVSVEAVGGSEQAGEARSSDGARGREDAGPLHRRRPCLPWCSSRMRSFASRRRTRAG